MAVDREAMLVRKFIDFAKLMNVYVNHFPKHERYALSNRIRNSAYEVYDLITEGQKRYHKKTTLTSLDIAHEQLRMQLFLAYELGYFRFSDGKAADSPEKIHAAIGPQAIPAGRQPASLFSRHDGASQGAPFFFVKKRSTCHAHFVLSRRNRHAR